MLGGRGNIEIVKWIPLFFVILYCPKSFFCFIKNIKCTTFFVLYYVIELPNYPFY